MINPKRKKNLTNKKNTSTFVKQYKDRVAIILSSFIVLIVLIVAMDKQIQMKILRLTQGINATFDQETAQSHAFTQKSKDYQNISEKSDNALPNSDVQLAEDFPDEVPLFAGKIIDSSRSEVARRKSWMLTVVSDKTAAQTSTEIQQSLLKAGWLKDSELIDDKSITLAFSKNDLSVVVYVAAVNKSSEIKYTVGQDAK